MLRDAFVAAYAAAVRAAGLAGAGNGEGKSSNPLCDIEDMGAVGCPGDLTLRDTAGADGLDGRPQRTDER